MNSVLQQPSDSPIPCDCRERRSCATPRRLLERARRALIQEAGSNLVETALVLPVYFLLIFGLISFSLILFAYCNASYASRAGARYAATHSSTSLLPCTSATISGLVGPYLWGAPAGGVSITTTWTPSNTIGSTATVNVSMTYTSGMPYLNWNGVVVSTKSQQVIVH